MIYTNLIEYNNVGNTKALLFHVINSDLGDTSGQKNLFICRYHSYGFDA